jgi:hypothetical protein
MRDFLRAVLKDSALQFAVFLFLVSFLWWFILHFVHQGTTSDQLQLWGATYQLIAWYGAITGLIVSKRWGGHKSYVGKAIIAFSIGLLFQCFGQTTYSFYVYALQQPIPYPSIGDIGFFGSIPCYFYGAFMLARVAGAKFSMRTLSSKIQAVVIPLALLIVSYFVFLTGYVFDFSHPLTIFLDFGYPFGEALYVSMAILAVSFSWKRLGGVMRFPIMLFIFALVIEYFCDFSFLYEAKLGIYYSGGLNDLLYSFSYTAMAIALVYIGHMYKRIQNT